MLYLLFLVFNFVTTTLSPVFANSRFSGTASSSISTSDNLTTSKRKLSFTSSRPTKTGNEQRTEVRNEKRSEARTQARIEARAETRTEERKEPRTKTRTEPRTEERTGSRTETRTWVRTEARTEPRTEPRTEERMGNYYGPTDSSKSIQGLDVSGKSSVLCFLNISFYPPFMLNS